MNLCKTPSLGVDCLSYKNLTIQKNEFIIKKSLYLIRFCRNIHKLVFPFVR